MAMLRILQRLVLASTALIAVACGQEPPAPGHDALDRELSGALPAGDAEVQSPSAGLTYARQACAGCHAVADGQDVSPDPGAPTFAAIADTPGMNRLALAALLRTSHQSMPNLIVDSARIDDLSDYIATLQTRQMPRPPAPTRTNQN